MTHLGFIEFLGFVEVLMLLSVALVVGAIVAEVVKAAREGRPPGS